MTVIADRAGSVQISRRASVGVSPRSGCSNCTHTARTTRPFRKRAATRQVRERTTSRLPDRIWAVRWNLGGAVDRQRLDLLTRHPLAILAWPSATPRPRRLWNFIEREVPADPADHGVAGREGAFDQPSAHEPGIEQDAHPAEPVAKQAQQEAGALELAAMGAMADQAQHQRHRSDLPLMFDDRGQAQP